MEKPNTATTKSQVDALVKRAEDFARREPTKAVATAFGAGILLHILPVRFVAQAVVAVAFSLTRPVLLFLGLMKASELCGSKNSKS